MLVGRCLVFLIKFCALLTLGQGRPLARRAPTVRPSGAGALLVEFKCGSCNGSDRAPEAAQPRRPSDLGGTSGPELELVQRTNNNRQVVPWRSYSMLLGTDGHHFLARA